MKTSKKWKSASELFVPTKLIVERKRNLLAFFHKLTINCKRDDYQEKDLRNRIFVSKFSTIHSLPFKLMNLNYLRVDTKICLDEKILMILNNLNELERFEIIDMQINRKRIDQSFRIVLPRLRTFFINNLEISNFDGNNRIKFLEIDAIKLKKLVFYSELKLMKLIHPHTIEHLEIEFYGNDDLSSFENLKYFQCNSSITLPSDLFTSLPQLDNLHCYESSKQNKDDYFEIENLIDELIRHRTYLGRKMNFFFNGTLLDGEKKFRDYGFYRDYGLNYNDTLSDYSSNYDSSFDSEIDSTNHSSSDSSIGDLSSLNDDSLSDDFSIGSSTFNSLILSNSSLSFNDECSIHSDLTNSSIDDSSVSSY